MTIDLWMLLAAGALHWLIVMVAASAKILINGVPWAAGNRHEPGKTLPDWVDRTDRLTANMLENLPLFIILVLAAHVSGTADGTTALGAMIFVAARAVHALVFMAGIPYARTLAWCVSVGGLLVIAYAIAV